MLRLLLIPIFALFLNFSHFKYHDDGWVMIQNFEILDGDTLRWKGAKYRFFGVDTPELSQKNERCHPIGKIVKLRLISYLKGCAKIKVVGLGFYGRYLAKIKSCGGSDVSKFLLSQGLATIYPYALFDSNKELQRHIEWQFVGQNQKRGVWGVKTRSPKSFRRSKLPNDTCTQINRHRIITK